MKSLSALLLSAVICFSFPSCQYMDIRNAVKFNDSIIKINQAIMSNAKIWGDSLRAGDYTSLNKIRVNTENYIQHHIEALEKMEAVGKGGEQFKREEISYLKMEKKVINLGFSPFEQLTSDRGSEAIQAANDNLDELGKGEEVEINRLKKRQQQYAEDNKFVLQRKKLI